VKPKHSPHDMFQVSVNTKLRLKDDTYQFPVY